MLIFSIGYCISAAVIVVHLSRAALSEADCPSDEYCADHGILTTIPDDIPPLASQIHLQDNQISSIQPGVFINNTVCTTLRLEFNELTTIRGNTWEGLKALKYLFLGGNNIGTVERQGFSHLPTLEGLYLENNKLTYLSQDIFYPNKPTRLKLMLFGNPFSKGDHGLYWIHEGQIKGWITRSSRLTTNIEALKCSPTGKQEIQNSTGSTTGSTTGISTENGGRSSRSITKDITMDTTTITMMQELSSLQPSGIPAIQPFESETKKPRTQLGKMLWVFVTIGVVCLVIVATATACFLRCKILSAVNKKAKQSSVAEIELLSIEDHLAKALPACGVSTQSSTAHQSTTQLSTVHHNIESHSQNFEVEIEPQPEEIQDRPAPALPPHTLTALQSTTQSSTTHSSATNSTPTQCPQTQDSEEYLIPVSTQSAASIYSYAYEHMVARIMEFLSLQSRGRLVTTTAEIHHHRFQHPHVGRNSSDPTSRLSSAEDSLASTQDSSALTQESVASTRNSLASAQDSLASTQLFPPKASGVQIPYPQEMSSHTDSDYLRGLRTDETPNGLVHEQIFDGQRISSVSEGMDNREIVMMLSNV